MLPTHKKLLLKEKIKMKVKSSLLKTSAALLILIFFLLPTAFTQTSDSLTILINKKNVWQGDTIAIDARLDNFTKKSSAATIHLWIEEIKTGRNWHYRYPIINGELHADLIVSTDISDGSYAFNFQLQKSFFNLSGFVKNAEEKDRLMNYVFITKNIQPVADVVPLNEDKSFSIGRLLFQDSAFIIFSKPKQNRNNLIVTLVNPLDSAFTPAATITQFIYVGKKTDSIEVASNVSNYTFNNNGSLYKTTLPEVVVQSKTKKLSEAFEKDNVTGFFSGGDAMVLDGLESDEIANAPSLISYLTTKVGGLMQETNENGMQQLKWRNHRTEIYINEIKADAEIALDINPSDIAIIKIFQPGVQISSGSNNGGTIAIYTKVGSYKKSENTNYSFYIMGYTGEESVWKK